MPLPDSPSSSPVDIDDAACIVAGVSIFAVVVFLLGVASVALAIRRSLWNYPFGLLVAAVFAATFYRVGLHREVLLHALFFAVQVYGFFDWRGSIRRFGEVRVESMRGREQWTWLAGAALLFAAWGLALGRFTHTTTPWLEASVVVPSLVAQTLMARRRVETWPLWILVDALSLGTAFRYDLHLSQLRDLAFPAMSAVGWFAWRRAAARARRPRLMAPATVPGRPRAA